jgi:glycosyltransferase involved in cell wall biosynthesis
MSGQPLVSVCMPCHNAERYVGEAVESVLNQTYKNIELIVVNDGSTDRSGEVLQQYVGRGVKVIPEKCGNASKARNRAFREAKGEYIKFFDADDLISPRMIERQLARLKGRQDAVAMSEWGRFYSDNIQTFKPNPQSVWRDMKGVDWLVEAIYDAEPMMQAGMFLIPRGLAERAGPWNEKLTLIDDFEYFCRLLSKSNSVFFVKGVSLFYRSGIQGSLSAQKSRTARESACESVLLSIQHILKSRNDAASRLSCANNCQKMIYDLYPYHADLRKRLQRKVESLGGAKIQARGGTIFSFLQPLVGWKLARIIQKSLRR